MKRFQFIVYIFTTLILCSYRMDAVPIPDKFIYGKVFEPDGVEQEFEKVIARRNGAQSLVDAEKGRNSDMQPAKVEFRMLLDRPIIEIQYAGTNGEQQVSIFDAETATRISPISEVLAKEIALADFSEKMRLIAYLEECVFVRLFSRMAS